MQIAVIQFPGSNCERETSLALLRNGMQPVPFLWNASPAQLEAMHGFVIVGGFSYEDRSRAGIIAALHPVMQTLKAQAALGKPILGICNGAQILVESGLVPGVQHEQLAMALTDNKRMSHGKILGTGYYNAWVHMRLSDQYQRNVFTRHLTNKDILRLPVAHAEGRFVIPPALLEEITMQGLNVFQYCDATGEINEHFPVNPNGSVNNIAAVSNKQGNVLAMMPHPERTPDCDALFASMRDAILEETVEHVMPLHYVPRYSKPLPYQQLADTHVFLAELVITDLQAWTVQNTLHQLGFPVTVRRKVHWEIKTQDRTALDHIKRTGMLYHDRKEKLCQGVATSQQVLSYLVRPKEDIVGQNKLQLLRDHFNLQAVETIKYGVLWELHGEARLIQELDEYLQHIHLLGNPYANDHYRYVSS